MSGAYFLSIRLQHNGWFTFLYINASLSLFGMRWNRYDVDRHGKVYINRFLTRIREITMKLGIVQEL